MLIEQQAEPKTEHFSFKEFYESRAAYIFNIPNIPPVALWDNIQATMNSLEELRFLLHSKPIKITSGYRNATLNFKVGGVTNSAHVDGFAVDFVCPRFGTPKEIFHYLENDPLLPSTFDELILEPSWVHWSIRPPCRRHCFIARTI